MRSKLRRAVCVACFVIPWTANAEVILNVVDGQLLGAGGVAVDGSLYDVTFLDGSCASLFSGCDSLSDFPFPSFEGAARASSALVDQVFLDSELGLFDADPQLTAGCDGAFAYCSALTPFGLSPFVIGPNGPFVNLIGAYNAAFQEPDGIHPAGEQLDPTFMAGGLGNPLVGSDYIWAVWTPQAAQVPEPATLFLIGSGLVALGFDRRRRPLGLRNRK